MSKNRPYIPPPIVTPPSVVVPRESATLTAREVNGGPVAPDSKFTDDMPVKLASVAPPPRVAKVELLADRIVITNPTILLDRHVELQGRDSRGQLIQEIKLKPARAEVMHGEIWIEELGLLIPIGAAVIRTF